MTSRPQINIIEMNSPMLAAIFFWVAVFSNDFFCVFFTDPKNSKLFVYELCSIVSLIHVGKNWLHSAAIFFIAVFPHDRNEFETLPTYKF